MGLKFIDLFAGIGGFRLGFEKQGFECVYSCEKDETTSKIYEKNFGDNPLGDITKIEVDSLPNFDILLAGIPCQSFSIAGKRAGFEDLHRGTLFFEVLRIVKDKKPKVVVIENVKNLLKHDNGNTFQVIKTALESEGYIVSYKILNAKDFGVAQNRERIIIVATKGVKAFDFNKLDVYNVKCLKDILKDTAENTYITKDKYALLDNVTQQNSGIQFAGYFLGKNTRTKGVDPSKLNLSRVHRQFNRIYGVDGVMCTLMSQETSGRYWINTDKGVRKLNKIECKRLMGLPDDFYIPEQSSIFYKCVGNSICVPMVEEIAKEVKSSF